MPKTRHLTAISLLTLLDFACSVSTTSDDEDRAQLVQLEEGPKGRDYETARRGLGDAMAAANFATIDVQAMSEQLAPGNTLDFALPDGDRATLVVQTVEELLPGITTFAGHLADDEHADFTFSIEDGKLVGSIRRDEQAWLVEPHAGSTLHMIRAIDRPFLPKDEPSVVTQTAEAAPQAPQGPSSPLPTSMVVGGGKVRVLFLYASNVSNANSQAANIVSTFNTSLTNSLVDGNNYLEIAGVQPVASSFNGQSREAILYAMHDRVAPFTGIDTAMANTYADIAFLLVQEDPTAADIPDYGRVGGVAYTYDQAHPFGLSTDDYALGDLTAIHEIGHIFGGRHEDAGDAAGIARPVVAADDTWMTIMGGYIDCPFNGLPATCVRLNRWSNPAQTYLGIPLGVVGERDMESHLESSMPIVSGWRAEPPAPPAAPSPLVKQSESCFGLHDMSWAAQPSATEYQLHYSTSSTFTYPVMIYGGPNTSTFINVSSGTWYLRARACNAGGCSGWTNQVSATRINGCL